MRIQRGTASAMVLLLACLIASGARAQERKIGQGELPGAVRESFAKAYPRATIRGTSMEVEKGVTYYEIESLDGAQARDILYRADGTVAEIEEAVAAGALPPAVKTAVGKEFAGAKIAKAEKVTKGSAVSYEVHLSQGSKKGSIVVDPSGKVLRKSPLRDTKEKEEDEEEED